MINRNKGSIITLHSHPNNNPPTGSDLLSAAIHGHKKGYVVTIAGDLHEYELLKRDEGAYRAFGVFDRKVAEERERVYNKDKIQAIRKTLKKLSGVVLWKEVK
nr:MAG TPA: MPN family protein [Caudoviricetes sp.]